jgi:hypothetical protein
MATIITEMMNEDRIVMDMFCEDNKIAQVKCVVFIYDKNPAMRTARD